ncbi:MAG: hypothetical protein PVH84_18120 [Candidatus Aminicenantes bacterium]|jgi:hypothetical protein
MSRSLRIISILTLFIILTCVTLDSSSYAGFTPDKADPETVGLLRSKARSSDPNAHPVIDQSLSWNTFIGSPYIDASGDVAVDGSGNIYVTGALQGTWGTPINAYAGGSDVFIAKFDTNGTLLWNTFVGSDLSEGAEAISVDASGNIYVSGYGYKSWGSPVAPFAGSIDAFVAKFDNTGALLWHTFMGSDLEDFSYGVIADGSGNIYVSGQSNKTWGTPIVPHAGANDVFVVKLDSSGALQWHTFMGGTGSETNRDIDIDGVGDILVSGGSGATWGTPINPHAGGNDAFVAKLNSSGALQWNTFLGASSGDNSQDISIGMFDTIYVAGVSFGSWGTPINPYAGNGDSFVAKLSSSGSLQWNTFQGSSTSDDTGTAISVTSSGVVYLVGNSGMSWGTPEDPHNGDYDFFLAGLSTSGQLHWNTFKGSTSYDLAYAMAQHGGGDVYVVGDSPATWGMPIHTYVGEIDVFVAKFSVPQVPDTTVKMGNVNFPDGSTKNLGTRPSSMVMGREFPFKIYNDGAGELNLTGSPAVTLSGPHASHFQVTQQPTTPVGPYSSATFKIRTVRDSLPGFLPVGWEYSVSFTVNIPNDDPDKNPYDFTINFDLKKD